MLFIKQSKPCKWKKPGARILHLRGKLSPIDSKDTPNSPFGASIAE